MNLIETQNKNEQKNNIALLPPRVSMISCSSSKKSIFSNVAPSDEHVDLALSKFCAEPVSSFIQEYLWGVQPASQPFPKMFKCYFSAWIKLCKHNRAVKYIRNFD